VNACPNGGTATIYVNAGSANGSQNFQQASTYLYIDGGTSVFSFLLSNYQSLTPPAVTRVLNNGSNYSIMLFGRADVPTSDYRFAKLVLLEDDHIAPPSGDAYIRFINAAPDAATSKAYFGAATLSNVLDYSDWTNYVAVPAGTASLSVTPSGAAPITLPQQFKAGEAYSVILTEPSIPTSSPTVQKATYAVWILGDDV